jgi:hypothetical protein
LPYFRAPIFLLVFLICYSWFVLPSFFWDFSGWSRLGSASVSSFRFLGCFLWVGIIFFFRLVGLVCCLLVLICVYVVFIWLLISILRFFFYFCRFCFSCSTFLPRGLVFSCFCSCVPVGVLPLVLVCLFCVGLLCPASSFG